MCISRAYTSPPSSLIGISSALVENFILITGDHIALKYDVVSKDDYLES